MSIRALLKIDNALRDYERRQKRRAIFWAVFAFVFICGMAETILSIAFRGR